MITGGTEVLVGVKDDQMLGPLVVFGLGGVATEVLADHAARLAPLTETDADTLINSIRSAPLLYGHRGAPAADIPALRDVLMRVSRLADDLPEGRRVDLVPGSTPTSSGRSRSTPGKGHAPGTARSIVAHRAAVRVPTPGPAPTG